MATTVSNMRENYELRTLKTTKVVHVAVLVPRKTKDGRVQEVWAGLLCDSTRKPQEVSMPTQAELNKPDNFCKSCQKNIELRKIKWEQIRQPRRGIGDALLKGLQKVSESLLAKEAAADGRILTELDLQKRNSKGEPIGKLKAGEGSIWNKALERLTAIYADAVAGKMSFKESYVEKLAPRLFISPNLALTVLAYLHEHDGQPPTLQEMFARIGTPVPPLPDFRTKHRTPPAESTAEKAKEAPSLPLPKSPRLGMPTQFIAGKHPPAEWFVQNTGYNKPKGVWSSTYLGPEKLSEWVMWGLREDFLKPPIEGYIVEVDPQARIYVADSLSDILTLYERYPDHQTKPWPGIDFERMAQDYDALHITADAIREERKGVIFTLDMHYLPYDAESTVWFRNKFTKVTPLSEPYVPPKPQEPIGARVVRLALELMERIGAQVTVGSSYRHVSLGEQGGFVEIDIRITPPTLDGTLFDLVLTERGDELHLSSTGEVLVYRSPLNKGVYRYVRNAKGGLTLNTKEVEYLDGQALRWEQKLNHHLAVLDQPQVSPEQRAVMERFVSVLKATFAAAGRDVKLGEWVSIPHGAKRSVVMLQENHHAEEPVVFRIAYQGETELTVTLSGEPMMLHQLALHSRRRIMRIPAKGKRLFEPKELEKAIALMNQWATEFEQALNAIAEEQQKLTAAMEAARAAKEAAKQAEAEKLAALALATEKAKSTNRRKKQEFQDVGDYIAHSRKEKAAKLREEMAALLAKREQSRFQESTDEILAKLAEIEAEDMAQAYEAVTKQMFLGEKFDPQAYRFQGFSSGATYLLYLLYRDIADRPQEVVKSQFGVPKEWKEADNAQQRREYVLALSTLMRHMAEAKTVERVEKALFNFKQEYHQRYGQEKYQKLAVLGENFFTRIIYTDGKVLANRREKATEYERNDDWSWAMPKRPAKSGQPGEETTESKPKKKRLKKPKLQQVIRIGGSPTPTHKAEDFLTVFKAKGIMFGNWVNDDEAEFHVTHCGAALMDLAEMLGYAPTDLFANGTMSLSFGSHGHGGKAEAVYMPDIKHINLTKNRGGGAVAHEWAHFLDNYVYLYSHRHQVGKLDGYGSQLAFGPYIPEEVKAAFSAWRKAVYATPAIVRVVYDPLQSSTDGRIKPIHHRYLVAAGYDVSAALKALAEMSYITEEHLWKTGHYYCRIANEHGHNVTHFDLPIRYSRFLWDAERLDGKTRQYMTVPTELFARSFEAFIEDKLTVAGRKNTYLVHSTIGGGMSWYLDLYTEGDPLPYPVGEERKRINEAIQQIVDAVRVSGILRAK